MPSKISQNGFFIFSICSYIGRTFSLNEWTFLSAKYDESNWKLSKNAVTSTGAMLEWNLHTLNYDTYIRQFVIGIQKYLHGEQFSENSHKWKITRYISYYTIPYYSILSILLLNLSVDNSIK